MYVDKEILLKYIKGELSPSEIENVLSWIEESEANFNLFAHIKSDYIFENMPNRLLPSSKPKRSLFQIINRVAALLLIPLCVLAAIYFYKQHNEISSYQAKLEAMQNVPEQDEAILEYVVNPGVKGYVVLPDGSQVWLNSASVLKTPARFSNLSREVELEGEAFFQVKGNEDWPMYVKTSKGITAKVVGTSFNISSYSNDSEMKFTLVSGNVILIKESAHQRINVKPYEEVIIPDVPKQKGKIKQNIDVQKSTIWKEGVLLFDNTPMSEVVKRMERWYGATFVIQDRSIYDYSFTGMFDKESLTQVLDILRISSNINYSLKGKEVVLYR